MPGMLSPRQFTTNSLIHTDWSASVPVQISFDEDTLEIGNVCILPHDWTPENPSFRKPDPLNPHIAGIFRLAGFAENSGSGIQKIHDACKADGAEPPEYISTESDIILVFHALESARICNHASGQSQLPL